ncbi:MAG: hypothetical protein KJ043_23170, partial [Anaerolineae bacterium]|nr:hypothetical protein [Anaerolineae bacterium]
MGEGLNITFGSSNTPESIGAFTVLTTPADQAESLSSLSLGVEGGDQLSTVNPNTLPPSVIGYSLVDDVVSALAGIERLEYDAPLNPVILQSLDLSVRYIYDPEQALVNDQQSSGTGVDSFYDVVVYSNGSEYALWMLQLGNSDPKQALLALPNQPVIQLRLEDNRGQIDTTLAEQGIVLQKGAAGRPERIGDFMPTDIFPTDTSLIWAGESGDAVKIGTLDTNERFIVDIEQGIALDRQYGYVFSAVEFYRNDSNPNEFAIWLGNGFNVKRPANAQFAAYIGIPNLTTLVNNPSRIRPSGYIPSTYEGYTQLISDIDRTAGTTFLQSVSFDYFGTAGDTIGVQNTETVGRPY